MSKPLKIKLSIPEPCHEDWDKMTVGEKGRFCGRCSNIITDFSGFTDKELVEYISKAAGKICGRFENTQLDRVIAIHEQANTPVYKRLLFGTALAAGVVSCTNNQNDTSIQNHSFQTFVDSTKKGGNRIVQSKDTLQNTQTQKSRIDSIPSTTMGIVVDVGPKFNGDIIKFLNDNIKYPQEAISKNLEGTVFASFTIEKDGSVSNVKLLRGIKDAPMLDSEAIRVLRLMPKWNQNGKTNREQFNIPIRFALSDSVHSKKEN